MARTKVKRLDGEGLRNLDAMLTELYAKKVFGSGIRVILPVYANNAAAISGGLQRGDFYRLNGDPDHVCVVH